MPAAAAAPSVLSSSTRPGSHSPLTAHGGSAAPTAGRLLDNPVSRYVADISFGIYIWHFLVIGLLNRLVPPAFDSSGDDAWTIWLWSAGATIVLSFGVATLSFYLLERPAVRWTRGLEARVGRRQLEAQPVS